MCWWGNHLFVIFAVLDVSLAVNLCINCSFLHLYHVTTCSHTHVHSLIWYWSKGAERRWWSTAGKVSTRLVEISNCSLRLGLWLSHLWVFLLPIDTGIGSIACLYLFILPRGGFVFTLYVPLSVLMSVPCQLRLVVPLAIGQQTDHRSVMIAVSGRVHSPCKNGTVGRTGKSIIQMLLCVGGIIWPRVLVFSSGWKPESTAWRDINSNVLKAKTLKLALTRTPESWPCPVCFVMF